jgi:hypothetical protein
MDQAIQVEVGERLDDRYEVLDRRGAGTMAYVVRALDHETSVEVACKIPLDTSRYKIDALWAQCRKLRHLSSKSLPAVLGYERHRTGEPSFPFLVMELVDGEELGTWAARQPLRRRVEVLAAVSNTVAELGAPHGDLDVRNVLVTDDDRVVLIDPEADAFGSSRQVTPEGRAQDLRGLRAVIDQCLSPGEQARLGLMLERLQPSDTEEPTAAEIAAGLRQLISLPLLPGETAASLVELATSHRKRMEDNRTTFRRIYQVRDLTFRNVVDMFRRLAEPLGLDVPNPYDVTLNGDFLLKAERSMTGGRGTLNHRIMTVPSGSGDEIRVTFSGSHSFRLPWPDAARPGLMDTGWLAVVRDAKPLSTSILELHEIDGTPSLLIAEPGRLRPLDEQTVDRALRLLVEFKYPGVAEPTFPPTRTAADPPLVAPDVEFLRPTFEALGIEQPQDAAGRLRSALEVTLRLPEDSALGNRGYGSTLGNVFSVSSDYDSRLKVIKAAVSKIVETHGVYFAPLYKCDVTILDERTRRLRVEVEGRIAGGADVTWPFEFTVTPVKQQAGE